MDRIEWFLAEPNSNERNKFSPFRSSMMAADHI